MYRARVVQQILLFLALVTAVVASAGDDLTRVSRVAGVVGGYGLSWVLPSLSVRWSIRLTSFSSLVLLLPRPESYFDTLVQVSFVAALAFPLRWEGLNRYPVLLALAFTVGASPVFGIDLRFVWLSTSFLVTSLLVSTAVGTPGFRQFGRPELVAARGVPGAVFSLAALAVLVPVGIVVAPLIPQPPAFSLPDNVPRYGAGSEFGGTARQHPGLTGRLDFGDQVSLGDQEVLRVEADRPLYLRGLTYSSWDGRYWRDFSEPDRVTFGNWVTLSESDPNRTRIRQVVTAVRGGLDVAVGADNITSFASIHRKGQVRHDGAVELYEPLRAGESYTVFSDIAIVTPDALRGADPAVRGIPAWMEEAYAEEQNVTPRVATLAREITAGADTTYDRVRVMEDWFDANVQYSRGFADYRHDGDLLEQFLFESRVGYCEQIATAMIVMLRSLGLPARMAVGYVPEFQDEDTGEWVSLERNAHAWTEVYFPGVGWQAFDPTSGVPLAEPLESGQPLSVDADVLLLAVVVATAAGAVVALIQLRSRRQRSQTRTRPIAAYSALESCGDLLEREWDPGRTISERIADLRRIGVNQQACDRAEALFSDFSYGPGGISEAELGDAVEELKGACADRRRDILAMGPKAARV